MYTIDPDLLGGEYAGTSDMVAIADGSVPEESDLSFPPMGSMLGPALAPAPGIGAGVKSLKPGGGDPVGWGTGREAALGVDDFRRRE